MSYYKQPYSFLLTFENTQDVEKIDEAIENKKLGYQKLGKQTYLGFFPETPSSTHSELRVKYKIVGKIHWVQLPYAEITE